MRLHGIASLGVAVMVIRLLCAAEYSRLAEMLRNRDEADSPHPLIFILPGLMSSRLVAWKHKRCKGADINIGDIMWLDLFKVFETMTFDKLCWLECLHLDDVKCLAISNFKSLAMRLL